MRVAGSHKAVAPMPEAFRWHAQVAECIVQPSMPRGSICFFMGYAGNHGTFAWHGAEQRRTVSAQRRDSFSALTQLWHRFLVTTLVLSQAIQLLEQARGVCERAAERAPGPRRIQALAVIRQLQVARRTRVFRAVKSIEAIATEL